MFGGLSVPPPPPHAKVQVWEKRGALPPVVGWVVSFRFPLGSWNVLVLLLRGLAKSFLWFSLRFSGNVATCSKMVRNSFQKV